MLFMWFLLLLQRCEVFLGGCVEHLAIGRSNQLFLLRSALAGQEIDRKMQAALSRRLPANTHVFDNIMDIFGDGRAWQAAFMQKGSFAEKVHMKNHAPCVREAYCVAHRQMCPLQTFCSARVGGTPCQDFSMSGNRLGLAGPQLPPLLAFGAKTEALRTPVVGLECVSELPTHVVHDAFGRNYDWPMANNLRPSNVGFPCTNRLRQAGKPHQIQMQCSTHGVWSEKCMAFSEPPHSHEPCLPGSTWVVCAPTLPLSFLTPTIFWTTRTISAKESRS